MHNNYLTSSLAESLLSSMQPIMACVMAAPAPLDAAQPHVGLITGVVTQPNICLGHSPAAEPCIHTRWADICQEHPAHWRKKSPDNTFNLAFFCLLFTYECHPQRYCDDAHVFQGCIIKDLSLEKGLQACRWSLTSLYKPQTRLLLHSHVEPDCRWSAKTSRQPVMLFTFRHPKLPEGHTGCCDAPISDIKTNCLSWWMHIPPRCPIGPRWGESGLVCVCVPARAKFYI